MFVLCSYFDGVGYAQVVIKGVVKDAETSEPLFTAIILTDKGKNASTDINGAYSIPADEGEYQLSVSLVGYQKQIQKVVVKGKPVVINFSLISVTLDEVEIVSDVATIRKTPVAFTNISSAKLQAELASQDLPMVLNSTPGVYATEQGGGSGDARITIRGFDQRNIGAMVDGVPVNDMENGWVYWSNWNGLSDVTSTIQVQRGLGASKLALPSVGGTMNIITKGIDSKRNITLRQEVGSDLLLKSSFGFNSGPMKGGWGVTLGGSRKTGEGWADQTWTDAWAYFVKIQKRFNKHLLSISGTGSPQKHAQRTDRLPIAIYNKKHAEKTGSSQEQIDSVFKSSGYTTAYQGERGMKYNPHWGYLDKGDGEEPFIDRINYFHKPQFNLSHFWDVSKKVYLSNITYLSVGNGGGTRFNNTPARDTADGQLNVQQKYDSNLSNIDALYSATEHKSTTILQSSVNNHFWYGWISNAIWKIDSSFTFTGGVDLRYYKGEHYQKIYDLFGGDYFINTSDKNQPIGAGNLEYYKKYKDDKINYYNDGYVKWGGLFSQVEYVKNKWSAFFTATVSETGYQRKDYFKKKDIVLPDTTLSQAVGWGDTIIYNGATYTNTSFDARYATSPWKWFLGYTAKCGANYNINDRHNVFINTGFLTIAPKFSNVFDNSNKETKEPKMQEVMAGEAGYSFHSRKFTTNLNSYYTFWKNKPFSYFPTIRIAGDDYYYTVDGLNELHKGIEADFIYKLFHNLDIEGTVSIGDWTINSASNVMLYDVTTLELSDTLSFSAKNIHTGDAAQIQYGGGIRYEPVKNFFIKAKYIRFEKNYANYDLINLSGENENRESWMLPGYNLLELHAGYNFKFRKLRFDINGSVINLLDAVYISDAQNGTGFDSASALVYMGQGRRFITSIKITF